MFAKALDHIIHAQTGCVVQKAEFIGGFIGVLLEILSGELADTLDDASVEACKPIDGVIVECAAKVK